MEENKWNFDQNRCMLYICMFFVTLTTVGFGTLFLGQDSAIILRNVIACMFSMGITVVVMLQSDIRKDYMVDNDLHPQRLMISYGICLLLMAVTGILSTMMLPREVIYLFPYMSVAVLFTIFSNFGIGLILYVHFIFVASLLCGLDGSTAFMYLLSGIIGCCLVRSAEKTYRVWLIIGSMAGQYTVLYIAYRLLNLDPKDGLLYECIWFVGGLFVNAIVLYLTLYLTDRKMIHKYVRKYEEITNPEYDLLLQLKEKAKSDYYNAVHTAYLSDRVARLLEADSLLAKAGGYYHKIGVLRAKSHVSKSIEIGKENGFPSPLIQLISEYTGRYETPKTVEAVIVMLSDAIVSTMLYMYEKDAEQKLDYDKIIEAVFKKKYESGILQDSGISLKDLHRMKEYYKSEALYYDFLR